MPSDRAGHARLLQLAQVQAPGRRVWALEGDGLLWAGLTRVLADQGQGGRGSTGPGGPGAATGHKRWVDAVRAGREALPADHLTTPRQREVRRCRKRSLARQLYRLLERTAMTDPWAVT